MMLVVTPVTYFKNPTCNHYTMAIVLTWQEHLRH
jgi:hypothetical protein